MKSFLQKDKRFHYPDQNNKQKHSIPNHEIHDLHNCQFDLMEDIITN
jgi:hypothetical protein